MYELEGLKQHVLSNCQWIVGDGQDIDAWNNAWIEEGLCLMQHMTIPLSLHGAKVSELVNSNGEWNWELLHHWMPIELQDKIAAILPPNSENGSDVLAGAGGHCTDFSVAYMYNKLCDFNIDEADPKWKKIWKLCVPERVRSFIWRLMWNRLLTNSLMNRMGLTSPMCGCCGAEEETSLHALRDCNLILQFWRQVVPHGRQNEFFMSNFDEWMDYNITNKDKDGIGVEWCDFWALACWCLWNWRNKEAHETNFLRPVNPVQHVLKLSDDYKRAMHANTIVMQKDRMLSYIKWKPPRENFVKLNTDGACEERRRSGCGGVIRGNQGEWLRGFAKNVGNCSAFIAELWGVLEGLCLAQRMGFTNVELSIDSQAVVQVLKVGKVYSIHGMTILKRIRDMLALNWVVEISHEYREANKCADALANIGCSLDRERIVYDECPFEIRHILLDDERGHSSPRLIIV